VIGPIEHNRVLCQSGVFEFFQSLARERIHLADDVIILRPVPSHFRRVGMICGDADFRRIMDLGVGADADLALVALFLVENGEEWLTSGTILPMRSA
jgi:hypothetical protein